MQLYNTCYNAVVKIFRKHNCMTCCLGNRYVYTHLLEQVEPIESSLLAAATVLNKAVSIGIGLVSFPDSPMQPGNEAEST